MTIHIIADVYDKIDEDTLRNKGKDLPHLKICFTQIVAGRGLRYQKRRHMKKHLVWLYLTQKIHDSGCSRTHINL